MREANRIMTGMRGNRYRRNLTSKVSKKIRLGMTQTNRIRSPRKCRRSVKTIKTVNGMASHATMPRGNPSPHTVVCRIWYRNAGVSTYCTVNGKNPASRAIRVCNITSPTNPFMSMKA